MPYEQLAYITGGNLESSTSITVKSQQIDGTNILVYASYELLGSSSILDGTTTVSLSRPLSKFDILTAYVETFGEKSGPAVPVSLSETSNTGWLIPSSVDGTPYQEWLQDGGAKIPAIYAPNLANRVASYFSKQKYFPENIAPILQIKPQYSASNLPQCKVSILSVLGLKGTPLYSFDNQPNTNSPVNLYVEEGSFTVRITDSADESRFVDVEFSTILPPDSSTPTNTNDNILTIGYAPDGNLAFVNIVAKQLCEISVDGLAQFENTGTQWAQCLSRRVWNGYIEQYALVSGIPEGSQTLRVRLISAPSNEISTSIFI